MLEVGRIERAHGLRGEVVVKLSTNVTERAAPGSQLWIAGRRDAGSDASGRPWRAFTIARSHPHQHRFIVAFDGVDSRSAAEALHGTTLYAEPMDDGDPDTLWIHELIGAEVVEVVDGRERSHGTVAAVIDNPASDLLELEGGALVPLRFVVDHSVAGRLVVDVPLGLFEDTDG